MSWVAVILFQSVLWTDVTEHVLPETREWTNRVEVADLDGDGRPDLLFANGGDYSEPGEPERNRVFFNRLQLPRLRHRSGRKPGLCRAPLTSWTRAAPSIDEGDSDSGGAAIPLGGSAVWFQPPCRVHRSDAREGSQAYPKW